MNSDESPPRPRWKKWIVPAASIVAILAVGIAHPMAWTALTGKNAWEKTQADLQARGEKLTIAELAPATPPPERNFYADPMWVQLTDLVQSTDPTTGHVTSEPRIPKGSRILDAMDAPAPPGTLERAQSLLSASPHSGLTAETPGSEFSRQANNILAKTTDDKQRRALAEFMLQALANSATLRAQIAQLAIDRPEVVFPTDYSALLWAPFPHITYLLRLGKIQKDLADAHLTLGASATAREEVLTMFRLADTLKSEPTLISLLVRISILGMATSTIETGIRRHAWAAQDLTEFSTVLERINLAEGVALSLRGERGFFNQLLNTLKSGTNASISWSKLPSMMLGTGGGNNPAAFLFATLYPLTANGDQEFYNRGLQQIIDVVSAREGLHPGHLPKMNADTSLFFRATHFVSSLGAANFETAIRRALHTQESILQLRVACALEEYWLVHRAYPASLSALAPGFTCPKSVFAGQTFQYRIEKDGAFRLWSAGWNETDEGGVTSTTRGDDATGDWVLGESPGKKP